MDHASSSEIPPAHPDDDRGFIDALRLGDETTFKLLVERYHPMLVRLALIYVHDRGVAEEVAQEAWLGMLTALGRFAGRASLKTWLFSILINCAKASYRREAHAIPFSLLHDPDADTTPAVAPERFLPAGHRWAGHWATPPEEWPEARLLAAETQRQVEQAVMHLPPHQRAVVTLRDLEGWNADEVCEVLKISAGNQRVLLHRARSQVRHEVEAYVEAARERDNIYGHG
jgi:RNA polymerase sigma-70 factor (ECF subfamily)